ncbi:MAG: GAF domain-containing protein, partial [Candidatus Rokuibacteriota bacterium]
ELYFEASRRRRQAEELARLAQSLTESLDVDAVAQRVVDSVRPLFGAMYSRLRLLQPDGALPLIAWSGEVMAPGAGSLQPGVGIAGLALASGRAEWSADVLTDERFRLDDAALRGLPNGGHCSVLAAPLRAKGSVIGSLTIGDQAGRVFSDEEIALLQTFADQAALALQNARFFEESEQRRRGAEALLDIAQALASTLELGEILTIVTRRTAQALGAERCTIFLRERQHLAPLMSQFADGRQDHAQWARFQALPPCRVEDVPAYAEAARTRRPVAMADALVVPIFSQDRLIGVLLVDHTTGPVQWTQEQADLAMTIATQTALAVENARLFTGQREQAEVSGALLKLTRATEAVADLDGILETVARVAPQLLGHSRCLVFLFDPAAGTLALATAIGFSDAQRSALNRLREAARIPAVVEAIRSHEPVAVEDAREDTWIPAAVAHDLDIASMLITPMVSGSRLMGTMAVDTAGQRTTFSDKQITLARSIAAHAAGAIERARLHAETERRHREADASAEALRRSEEHLRQMQKMEAIGRLAGGIAHDFNNLLTVITGRSQLLLRRLRDADPVRQDIALVQKTAERAGALTRQLLAFSRKQVLQPRVVDINAIVQGLAQMLQRLLGEDVELTIRPTADGARVKADPGQLEQVIVNLAVNARDAMPGGGRLVIAIDGVELDEAAARQHGGAPGAHVELAVSDSGIGMDVDTQARIFEPFFTTKAAGRGTGLGLATVYGIVKQHQGAIAVESGLGRGTTFRIYLPATTEPAETVGSESGLPAGSETVLVAEDEDEVRALARDILQQVGYTVLEAGNGQEAIEVCRSHPHPIHLLLSDLIMPQMSGHELAEHLKISRPGIK